MKKSTKSPSRIKYERWNPTVSARLPVEKRTKLLLVLGKLGVSLRDVLISIADELAVKVKPLDEARRDGYQEGYEEAKKRFMVPFACSICGKPLAITSPEAKEVAGRFMTEHGWGHADCHEKKRQR